MYYTPLFFFFQETLLGNPVVFQVSFSGAERFLKQKSGGVIWRGGFLLVEAIQLFELELQICMPIKNIAPQNHEVYKYTIIYHTNLSLKGIS